MKFSELYDSIYQQVTSPNGHRVVTFIEGRPGGGKSALTRKLAQSLAEEFLIPTERIVEFNASLRDPVDIMGIPMKSGDGSHCEWLPPTEFWNLRDGVGPCILILEELTDAPIAMQNPMCRLILDRYAGNLKLSDQLYIFASGNRVEDRSGANRMSTKLSNRMRVLDFEEDINDWVLWAKEENLPEELIAFLQYRPELLCDFDPSRNINPTPRAWENVSRIPDFRNDPHRRKYLRHVQGDVGEGPAREYLAFKRTWKKTLSVKQILADPLHVKLPEALDFQYASVFQLCYYLNADSSFEDIDAAFSFISRFTLELQAMALQQTLASIPMSRLLESVHFQAVMKSVGKSTQ